MAAPRIIIAGDMNAYSRMWNGRAAYQRNDTFWEDLIRVHGLTIHNSEEATRSGANTECHSIIDLTLTKGNVNFRWSIADEGQSTGSDHEILVWEEIEKNQGGPPARSPPGGISGVQADRRNPRRAKKQKGSAGRGKETMGGSSGKEGTGNSNQGGSGGGG